MYTSIVAIKSTNFPLAYLFGFPKISSGLTSDGSNIYVEVVAFGGTSNGSGLILFNSLGVNETPSYQGSGLFYGNSNFNVCAIMTNTGGFRLLLHDVELPLR